MKWFDKWFSKKCKEAWDDARQTPDVYIGSIKGSTIGCSSIGSHGINFTLHKASGGYVVEYRTYDEKNDRNNNRLHIITDEKELGEELSKIITFESLRS